MSSFSTVGGVLHLDTREFYEENDIYSPLCPICSQKIRWCLDMASFTTGFPHRLAHARCVWTPEAFRDQAKLARAAS